LKTTTDQNVVSQQDMIPVPHFMPTSVTVPNAVGSIQHMPINNVVGHYPSAVLTSPAFPLPVGPYFCLPPPLHVPVHRDAGTEGSAAQIPTCQEIVPEHHISQDSNRFVQDSQVSGEVQGPERRVCDPLQQQPTHDRTDERWSSSDRRDDTSYRDKILDDDMSRERLEKRLMKERVEKWKIRDGADSDRVEFERLRTPHRNIIDAGTCPVFLTQYGICRETVNHFHFTGLSENAVLYVTVKLSSSNKI